MGLIDKGMQIRLINEDFPNKTQSVCTSSPQTAIFPGFDALLHFFKYASSPTRHTQSNTLPRGIHMGLIDKGMQIRLINEDFPNKNL